MTNYFPYANPSTEIEEVLEFMLTLKEQKKHEGFKLICQAFCEDDEHLDTLLAFLFVNNIERVANIFGVKLYEPFMLEGNTSGVYWLTAENGMAYQSTSLDNDEIYYDCEGTFLDILYENYKIVSLRKIIATV